MINSKWETKARVMDSLNKEEYKGHINCSGLPIIYDNKYVYLTRKGEHSLVIGATGSGKTQTIMLPSIKLSMLANNSVVINDPNGELYKTTAEGFKSNGYNVIVLDFEESKYGNYYNPLSLAHLFYKDNNKDKCMSAIEDIGYYIFTDTSSNMDVFWTNTATDYFTGLCRYLFEKGDNEVSFKDIFELGNKLSKEDECEKFLKEIGKESVIYYNVAGTLTSPNETKGGIISTFNQKLKRFINRENLSDMMSKTDFDLKSIVNDKTAVYIKSGYKDYGKCLVSLFVHQLFEITNTYGRHEQTINVLLEDFDDIMPIKDCAEILSYSRGINLNFTCFIKSFAGLIHNYGKEDSQIVRLFFSNIVYLIANDLITSSEMSKMCGNETANKPLVSVEELNTLQMFEAVVLLPRLMPYKAYLTPDYKIDWGTDFKESEFALRK